MRTVALVLFALACNTHAIAPKLKDKSQNPAGVLNFVEVQDVGTDIENFLTGLFTGLFSTATSTEVLACVDDIKKTVSDIKASIPNFELNTTTGISAGLSNIADALNDIAKAITDCTSGFKALVADLEAAAAAFSDPAALEATVAKNFTVNGVAIGAEILSGVAAGMKGDYSTFGKSIGESIDKLLGFK